MITLAERSWQLPDSKYAAAKTDLPNKTEQTIRRITDSVEQIINDKGKSKDHYTFSYVFHPSNKKVKGKQVLERINALKIPPAWTGVIISGNKASKLQVTGYDSKGKKQYIYHKDHVAASTKSKFQRLRAFTLNIDKFLDIIDQHSKLPFFEKRKVVSFMFQLISRYHFRVGKEIYARTNKSYGVSSLRKRHVKVVEGDPDEDDYCTIRFVAKSKMNVTVVVRKIEFVHDFKRLFELPGEYLFQYLQSGQGAPVGPDDIKHVTDVDLNQYMATWMPAVIMNVPGGDSSSSETSGQASSTKQTKFTVKDFRTYAANIIFINNLINQSKKVKPKNTSNIKKNVIKAVKKTAKLLKHTTSVSRKSYIMQHLIDLYTAKPGLFALPAKATQKETDETVRSILLRAIDESQ